MKEPIGEKIFRIVMASLVIAVYLLFIIALGCQETITITPTQYFAACGMSAVVAVCIGIIIYESYSIAKICKEEKNDRR